MHAAQQSHTAASRHAPASLPACPLLQTELQDELARLRAELTAALSVGGGGGHTDVVSAVLGPRGSAGGECRGPQGRQRTGQGPSAALRPIPPEQSLGPGRRTLPLLLDVGPYCCLA